MVFPAWDSGTDNGPMTDAGALDPLLVHDGLALYRIGQGEPVLLMPGPHRFQQAGDGSAAPLVDGLVSIGRQVVTFDPPGAGHSDRPAHVSMAEMHDCADETLAVLGLEGPVDALGHSMGGLTVLGYALERPGHVRRLVLVGTGTGRRAYMRAPGALWNRTHPHFWGMVARAILQSAVRTRAPEALLLNYIQRESYVDRSLADSWPIAPADWWRPRRGRTEWHRVVSDLDYGPRLAEVAAPTLVLCGRHDPQYPPNCSEELAAGIPGARLMWFERSGHYPFREEPQTFWAAVDGFLSEPSPR